MTAPAPTASQTDYPRYPREIAARMTLRVAATALLTPTFELDRVACVAISTACGPLATRLSLVRLLGAPATEQPTASSCVPYEAIVERGLPDELYGIGPEPGRARLELAGQRLEQVGDRWEADLGSLEYHHGVAGALALSAWCAWALHAEEVALRRAHWSRDLVDAEIGGDAMAGFIVRAVTRGLVPAWWG